MYEERRSVYATIPKTQEDVITTVKSMELTTNKGENFLLLANEVNRIIIFSCFTNLHFLCQVDNIYVDGTFQYCSNFFFQMFTLHGFKNGHYVPLIFCLLPNKTAEIYIKVLQLIIEKCKCLFTMDIRHKKYIRDT
jgi:hypothetical protein